MTTLDRAESDSLQAILVLRVGDARNLYFDLIDELGLERLPVEQAGMCAGYAHARLITSQMLPARAAARLVAHLVVSLNYPSEPWQLMDLYGLDDMCDISYQSEDRIHRDVLDAATSLVAEHEADHQHLSQPSLTRIAKLVIP